jgi:hypothetical protein
LSGLTTPRLEKACQCDASSYRAFQFDLPASERHAQIGTLIKEFGKQVGDKVACDFPDERQIPRREFLYSRYPNLEPGAVRARPLRV